MKKKYILILLIFFGLITLTYLFATSTINEKNKSNNFSSISTYLDREKDIASDIEYEYTLFATKEILLNYSLEEDNLVINTDIKEKTGNIKIAIIDNKNKEVYNYELKDNNESLNIPLPKGNYKFKIIFFKGKGSGIIKWGTE
ncbi:MAG: hypothetical protein ACOWWH_00570 [Eubacteriaceae bacterium]